MRKREIHGYLCILIGSTFWGFTSVVAKSLFNIGLPPAEFVLIRLTLTTLILFPILLLFDRRRLRIDMQGLLYFPILSFFGVAGLQFTFYFAISQIQIGPVVLVQYIYPVWIALYAFLFQKEPLSKGKIGSLFLTVLGCYFVVGGYRMDLIGLNWIGIASALASSFLFAFYTLYGERGLRRYDPWTIILYGFGFGAVYYWILISPAKVLKVITEIHSFKIWLAFSYVVVFSTLISFGLYLKGIERIRATRASITSTWEPVTATFSAYLILGEILHPFQVLGGIAVIAAVILLQISKEKAAPPPSLEIRQEKR
jgi:drug/metabolite transporter (DMT)-like permease